MSDSTKHASVEAEASSANALGERLIRRGTEPLGVIDVRYAEEKYLRIVRWLARNSALLDHLRRRYEVEEPAANAEHPFAIQRLLGQQVNVFSTTIQSLSPAYEPQAATSDAPLHPPSEDGRPSSLAQIIAERSLDPVSEQGASPEGEFRISRRPPPMFRKSDATPHASPRAGSVSAAEHQRGGATVEADSSAHHRPAAFASRSSGVDGTEEKIDVTTGASAQEKLPSAAGRTEQAEAASSIVQREVFGSSSTQETASPSVRNEQAGAASSIVQREAFGSSSAQETPSPSVRNDRVYIDSSFVQREEAGITHAQERAASVRDQVNKISPIPQREVVRDASAQEPPANLEPEPATRNQKPEPLNPEPRTLSRIAVRNEQARSASSIVQRADRVIANALSVSSPPIQPLAEPPRQRTLLPEQSAGAAPQPEYGDVREDQNLHGSQTSSFVPGAIAAAEIRGDSFNQERLHIVWREPGPGARAADFTAQESRSDSAFSRGAQSGPIDFFPAIQQSGQDGLAARTQKQSQEIEIEHISPRVIRSISERVIRAITLDLKFERERRGVSKWR